MYTHNLCFEQKYEKYQNFYLKPFSFLVVVNFIYLNRRVFVMLKKERKDISKLSSFVFCSGTMINLKWLGLPMSRTNFHGPKDVRAIEIRL